MDLANYALMTVVEIENEEIGYVEECYQDLDFEPMLDHEINLNINEPACDISSVIEELEKQFKELAPIEGRDKKEKNRPNWMTRCLGESVRDCEREK